MQTLAPRSATRHRSPAVDIAIAVGIGLTAALAKRYLDFHLGIPGHAGVGWIAVLVFGRLINPRIGMATVAGLSMALWGVPVGLGHSVAYNMMLYGMAGALLDSGTLVRLPLHRAWGAALAGVIVHVAKFGVIIGHAWVSGILRRVEIYGFMRAFGNHIVFGALGGVLGWALWRAGPTLRSRLAAIVHR
ncbi:hypothetical protein ACFLRH_02155 [Actinomycetota bacterium]